jgi:hypothetical protein
MFRRVPVFVVLALGVFVAAILATIYESVRLSAAPHGYYVIAYRLSYRRTYHEPQGYGHGPYRVSGPYETMQACTGAEPPDTYRYGFECVPSRVDDAAVMPQWAP